MRSGIRVFSPVRAQWRELGNPPGFCFQIELDTGKIAIPLAAVFFSQKTFSSLSILIFGQRYNIPPMLEYKFTSRFYHRNFKKQVQNGEF